ncbi:MAG: DUF6785 family protein [Planctomycetota bacterium]
MPIVGLILGLILALWISVFTLFNDSYLLQPLMTGNLMPTSVYGPAVLLVLLTGGFLWRKLGQRQIVGRRDVVAMIVIATAACAWPGTNFLRTFVGSTGNVANLAKTNDHWQSPEVLSYVPHGLLLGDGREVPDVTDTLVAGVEPVTITTMADGEEKTEQRQVFAVDNVPWAAWWPMLRTWGGLALLLGLASVCLGVIVHPQWSRYEKLPYPLVRLIEELTKPKRDAASADLLHGGDSGGSSEENSRGRPAILTNRLFWLGLASVATIHLVNGLDAWIGSGGGSFLPLKYSFDPLRELLPNASRAQGSSEQFMPQIFFSVVAFTFFIRGDVSFSVGVSSLVWVALGAVFIANGEVLGNNPIETDGGTLLRAGAYLGFAAMLLYLGRRYYGQIAASALWLRRRDHDQRSGVWAARGLAICLAGMVWMLARYVGLDWRLGLIVVGLVMVMLLILARLSAETGMFYLEPNWMPLVVLSAILGFEGMGPAAFLGVALFSVVITGAPREPLTGYVVNALHLSERVGGLKKIGRVGLGVAAVATVTLGLAFVATLVLGHTRGLSPQEDWANRGHPGLPFNALARRLAEADAAGKLDSLIASANAGHFAAALPDWGALGWLFAGAALVVGCTLARLRLAWWPIHPVLFLVLGSSPAIRVGWSFLIGWALRQAVVRLGGVKAFHATLPLAVGAIAGELLAALGWQTCGIAYHFLTGENPSQFLILPN